jgi:hypothetical protein
MSATIPTRRTVKPAAPPAWIKPQIAKLVDGAFHGPDWLHEIKFDGYRMHARLDAGRVQILTAEPMLHGHPAPRVGASAFLFRRQWLDRPRLLDFFDHRRSCVIADLHSNFFIQRRPENCSS